LNITFQTYSKQGGSFVVEGIQSVADARHAKEIIVALNDEGTVAGAGAGISVGKVRDLVEQTRAQRIATAEQESADSEVLPTTLLQAYTDAAKDPVFVAEMEMLAGAAPTPTPAEASIDDAVAALKTFLASNGTGEAVKILAEFKVARVTELAPEQRGAFIAALKGKTQETSN
jgi:hypothetical protein